MARPKKAKKAKALCTVVDSDGRCLSPVFGLGMCQKHHARWRKHGSPLVTHKRGRKNRLSRQDIAGILQARQEGELQASLAARYGVTRQWIGEIEKKHRRFVPKEAQNP